MVPLFFVWRTCALCSRVWESEGLVGRGFFCVMKGGVDAHNSGGGFSVEEHGADVFHSFVFFFTRCYL